MERGRPSVMADQYMDPIGQIIEVDKVIEKTPTVDSLVMDILSTRLNKLHVDTKKELEALKERQKEVEKLHDLIAKINSLTDKEGIVKVDDELYDMLQDAIKSTSYSEEVNDIKISGDNLKILKSGETYQPEDRQRLTENLRMHIEDLNTQNDMQLQTVTQLTNERYETYQMARAVLKPLDEDKKRKAQGIAGR